MISTNLFKKLNLNLLYNSLFVAFLLALLLTRLVIFFNYNLKIIDTDQPYMWLGASDYAKGLFYEPRYYGQAYNTFFEALVAVPLLWLKVPVHVAVPFATHLISLFPFLFTCFYLFFKHKKLQALLVLSVLLCLPVSYDLLNSLPRGFVSGLFFASFFIISILQPSRRFFIFFNTSMVVIGYFVNPNSTIVTIPLLFYLFLSQYKQRGYYLPTLAGLLMFWPAHEFFNRFYLNHPDYIQNPIEYNWSASVFVTNINHLDDLFAHLSFFTENNCVPLLIVIAGLMVLAWMKNKMVFYSLLVFVTILLVSFFMGKTREGTTWVFISFSRFYLGIPLYLVLLLSAVELKGNKLLLFLFALPLFFSVYRLTTLEHTLAPQLDEKMWVGPHLVELKNALNSIDFYKDACQKTGTDYFLIANRVWLNNVLAYGGPAVCSDFPETQETKLEKRYWVRNKNNNRVITSFVFLSNSYRICEQLKNYKEFSVEPIDSYGLVLVKNNTLTVSAFTRLVQVFENE